MGMLRSPVNQMVYGTRSPKKWNLSIYKERTSCIQRNESFIQTTSEKAKVVENIDAEPTIAQLSLRTVVSDNQLRSCGAMADWCQEFAQRVDAHSPQSTGTVVAKRDNGLASQVPSEDVSSLTKGPLWSHRARDNLVRRRSWINKCLPRRWFREKCLSRTVLYDHSRCSFGRVWLNKPMSRIHVPSKWRKISTKLSYSIRRKHYRHDVFAVLKITSILHHLILALKQFICSQLHKKCSWPHFPKPRCLSTFSNMYMRMCEQLSSNVWGKWALHMGHSWWVELTMTDWILVVDSLPHFCAPFTCSWRMP